MLDRDLASRHGYRPAASGKTLAVLASVGLHVAAILGTVFYSFFHIEPRPAAGPTFMLVGSTPSSPPLSPPASGVPKSKPRIKRPENNQPAQVSNHVQPEEPETKESDGEANHGAPAPLHSPGGPQDNVAGGTPSAGPCAGPPSRVSTVSSPQPVQPKVIPYAPDPGQWIARSDPHVPDAIKVQRKGTEAVFFAKVCVDQRGHLFRVDVLQSLPGADESIVDQMRKQWTLKPQPIPICFPVRLVYTFE